MIFTTEGVELAEKQCTAMAEMNSDFSHKILEAVWRAGFTD